MSKKHRRAVPNRASVATADAGGSSMSRRAWLGFALGGAAVALGAERWWRLTNPRAVSGTETPIIVYATPTCGCCKKWMSHLESSGFDVRKEMVADVSPVKRKYLVPEDLWSCHTAIVDGYAIEGHVPADLIQKVLVERPAIAGLAAPGMPNGSPGMEGPVSERYEIISFRRSGQTELYAVRG